VSGVHLSDDVLVRSLGDETVLLDLRTGCYFGLNRTGARLLELVTDVGDVEAAARLASTEFGIPVDQVAADLDELCAELTAQGLLEPTGTKATPDD
jgi:transposase InsO family protein